MSDWQSAIAQAVVELNAVMGETVTVGATPLRCRMGEARAEFVETDTGHQRVYLRTLTIDKGVRATVVARGTAVAASDGTYLVKAIINEDYAARTYELVKG